jgi:D-threonate/D-erythronate kinase
MPRLVIVADDLTGAADTGACFASAGFATVIPLSGTVIPNADVVVLSTDSRDMSASDAARAVTAAMARMTSARRGGSERGSDADSVLFYKKIDSALRGHPRDELLAVMEATGARRALVAPAFPAEGRTTVGGRQHIDGVPVESSGFGGAGAVSDLMALFETDQGPPVRLLDLAALRGQPDALRRLLHDDSDGIVVADAETDDDLTMLGRAVDSGQLPLLCGSAGLARQLAHSLPLTRNARPQSKIVHGSGPTLIVAGSHHEATARQIQVLRQAGVPVVRPEQSLVDDPATSLDSAVVEVARHLAAGRSMVLTTLGLAPCPLGGHVVAARLGQIAAAPEVRSQVGGLVLTGGDVAAAVSTALGATALWLEGEITPGIPRGVLEGGRLHASRIVTKAGSFGDDNALLSCINDLTSEATRVPRESDQGVGRV